MILETQDEINAFKFLCDLANESTNRICNDLEPNQQQAFGHLLVKTFDMETESEIDKNVEMDFEVVNWLIAQVTPNSEKQKVGEEQ